MLPAPARREPGAAAGRDQDRLCGYFLFTHLDRVRIEQFCVRVKGFNPGVVQQLLIDTFQPVDFLVLVGDQAVPVKAGFTDPPAETGGILEILVIMAGVGQQLFGHTASDHTGSAVTVGFRQAYPRAGRRRHARTAHATGSATDHKKIEVITAHVRISIFQVRRFFGRTEDQVCHIGSGLQLTIDKLATQLIAHVFVLARLIPSPCRCI